MAEEKRFENKIKEFLKEQGAWYIKYWAGSQYTKKGIPDLLACVNGYFIAIEVKATAGIASKLQLRHIDKIRNAGGFAFVVYPSGFDKLKEFIEGLKQDCFPDITTLEVILK